MSGPGALYVPGKELSHRQTAYRVGLRRAVGPGPTLGGVVGLGLLEVVEDVLLYFVQGGGRLNFFREIGDVGAVVDQGDEGAAVVER